MSFGPNWSGLHLKFGRVHELTLNALVKESHSVFSISEIKSIGESDG